MCELWNPNYETEGIKIHKLIKDESNQYNLVLYAPCTNFHYEDKNVRSEIKTMFPSVNIIDKPRIDSDDSGCIYHICDGHIIEYSSTFFGYITDHVVIVKYKNDSLELFITNSDELNFVLNKLREFIDKKKSARTVIQ